MTFLFRVLSFLEEILRLFQKVLSTIMDYKVLLFFLKIRVPLQKKKPCDYKITASELLLW